MFELRVRLFANLKEIVGGSTISLTFESPPTPNDVIRKLTSNTPELEKYLIKDGTFNERYKILVGSEEVPKERFSEPISLKEISILPPVSGG